MNLDANWRVRSDRYQFILEERTIVAKRDAETRQPTGETTEEWKVYGYYPSVEQLTRATVTAIARTAAEAHENFDRFYEAFIEACAANFIAVMDEMMEATA